MFPKVPLLTLRDILNLLLTDWFIPLLIFVAIVCVAISAVKNQDNLADANAEGRRWAGLFAMLKEAAYWAIVPIIILAIIKFLSDMKITI